MTKDSLNHPASRTVVTDVVAHVSLSLKMSGIASHLLDAQLITACALGLTKSDLYLHPDHPVDPQQVSKIAALAERRAAGTPIAYITGNKEFWSLDLCVDERVLIPRPETELLVQETLLAAGHLTGKHPRMLEIGTGSGAVSLAVLLELSDLEIVVTDISADALSVAAKNFELYGVAGRIEARHGDLYGAVGPGELFDLIVSNPPYLTTQELKQASPDVRSEPPAALLGGDDGLDLVARLITGAPGSLAPEGRLVLEIGATQAEAVRDTIERTPGLIFSHIARDLAGNPRVAVAKRSS
jgi:release factor glutamine methyltransferase